MRSSGWVRARSRASKRYKDMTAVEPPAGFESLRVQDLRHTRGRRLRATNVSLEDREDLLGHRSDRVTTHYSAAKILNRRVYAISKQPAGGISFVARAL